MGDFIAYLANLINGNSNLPDVHIGQLEDGERDVSIQLAPSTALHEFFDRDKVINVSVLILAKSQNQSQAVSDIDTIINHFSTLRSYPRVNQNINWLTSTVTTYTNFVDKTDNKYYLYSAVLENKINYEVI